MGQSGRQKLLDPASSKVETWVVSNDKVKSLSLVRLYIGTNLRQTTNDLALKKNTDDPYYIF